MRATPRWAARSPRRCSAWRLPTWANERSSSSPPPWCCRHWRRCSRSAATAAAEGDEHHGAAAPAATRGTRALDTSSAIRRCTSSPLCAVLFHLSNAAMLPLALNELAQRGEAPGLMVSAAIIVPQIIIAVAVTLGRADGADASDGARCCWSASSRCRCAPCCSRSVQVARGGGRDPDPGRGQRDRVRADAAADRRRPDAPTPATSTWRSVRSAWRSAWGRRSARWSPAGWPTGSASRDGVSRAGRRWRGLATGACWLLAMPETRPASRGRQCRSHRR